MLADEPFVIVRIVGYLLIAIVVGGTFTEKSLYVGVDLFDFVPHYFQSYSLINGKSHIFEKDLLTVESNDSLLDRPEAVFSVKLSLEISIHPYRLLSIEKSYLITIGISNRFLDHR